MAPRTSTPSDTTASDEQIESLFRVVVAAAQASPNGATSESCYDLVVGAPDAQQRPFLRNGTVNRSAVERAWNALVKAGRVRGRRHKRPLGADTPPSRSRRRAAGTAPRATSTRATSGRAAAGRAATARATTGRGTRRTATTRTAGETTETARATAGRATGRRTTAGRATTGTRATNGRTTTARTTTARSTSARSTSARTTTGRTTGRRAAATTGTRATGRATTRRTRRGTEAGAAPNGTEAQLQAAHRRAGDLDARIKRLEQELANARKERARLSQDLASIAKLLARHAG